MNILPRGELNKDVSVSDRRDNVEMGSTGASNHESEVSLFSQLSIANSRFPTLVVFAD
jgi:hypothetical protein